SGFVASMARPGGNITGRTFLAPETAGKLLEVLKETVPTITRVVHFGWVAGFEEARHAAEAGAKKLGLTVRAMELPQTGDPARVLEDVSRWQPDALSLSPVGIPAGHRDAILNFAVQRRLPTVSTTRGMVEAGVLMVYAPSALESARRVGYYVDKVLKG